jgi:hypothetical protein|tara:strand:+ start:381 stop:656 length:276 start_codon:yes stop_codon:yes gene_type:complete
MLNLIIMSVVLGCTVTDLTETGVAPMQDPTIQSLEKSAETLDRMIVKTEKMSADLEIMIQNQEAIFRAVTKCISDETCTALRNSMTDFNGE